MSSPPEHASIHPAARSASTAGLAALLCIGLAGCQSAPATVHTDSGTGELNRIAQRVDGQGNPALAASLYAQAAKKSPTAGNFVALGNTRLAADQPGEAADAFRAALKRKSDDTDALLGLGEARLRQGEFAYAIKALAPAARKLNTVHAWSELGIARIANGDANGASIAFGKAAALTSNLDVQSNLALAQVLAGNDGPAIARMRRVCNSPLAETRHFRNLLLILVLAGDQGQARALSIPGMSQTRKQALLKQAESIRALPGVAARARAIGIITPGGATAPGRDAVLTKPAWKQQAHGRLDRANTRLAGAPPP